MITTAKIIITLFIIANNGEGIALPVKNFSSMEECNISKVEYQTNANDSDNVYACF